MRSITNETAKEQIEKRILQLSENDERKWGAMSVHQAVCHMADQIRIAMEVKKAEYRGNLFIRTVVKKLILSGMSAPKGKVETSPELKQGGGGTKPVNFERDKQTLLKLVNDFHYQYSPAKKSVHPAFGPLSREEWGKLAYSHLNHHLAQFGK
jgi:hypothetical protein